MALSTLNAFLTGKTIALAASVALAGGGAAVVTTNVATDNGAGDGLGIGAAAVDRDDRTDGDDTGVEGRQRAAEVLAGLELADPVARDELVPALGADSDVSEGTDGDENDVDDANGGTDGEDGRAGAVHEALAGDLTPADGAEFGAAVSTNATTNPDFGHDVAAAARGDKGPQDRAGEDARVEGQERAAEARARAGSGDEDDESDDTEDTTRDDAQRVLPDAAGARVGNGPSND